MTFLARNKWSYSFSVLTWCFVKAVDFTPIVKTSEQPLLCGDPPLTLGSVAAAIQGENLEVSVRLSQEKENNCKIIENHICNMPTPTQQGDSLVDYSIPVETVYNFVCLYESDFFVVAGHATVQCKDEFEHTEKTGQRRLEKSPNQDGYVYAAYYEIPINCEEVSDDNEIKTDAELLAAVLDAEIVSLNHLWDEQSPINPFNPGYDLRMVDTHAKTTGLIPGLSFASDAIDFSGQHGGPTLDAIGHMGQEGILFGGIPASEVETPNGLSDLGIDTYPESKYINRGVFIDVARCKGVDKLEIGYEVTSSDISECADKQNVEIMEGDSVLIRVGFGPLYVLDKPTYLGENGPYPAPSEDAARYLASKKIFLAGIDNLSFELFGRPFPAHRILVAENGIYIAENFYLETLSAKCAELETWEFAVVVNPLKVYGATGMALNVFALFAR